MCVIAVVDKERPTDDMVERMFDANNSGAGVAWRENGAVRWKKGLDVDEIKELCRTVPIPFVAHFRIPSCGGAHDTLCHPFPIEKGASVALEGTFKGFVLFHNGHWAKWKETVLDSAVRGNVKIPVGKFSDSRAMALMAAYHGLGILEFIDEKIIAFGPNEIEVFGFGWSKVNEVWVSNKSWENNFTYNRRSHKAEDKKDDVSKETPPKKADDRLPVHYTADKEDDKKKVLTGEVVSGGDDLHGLKGGAETPFEVALRLWGQGKLSKKALKRARRKWEAEQLEGKARKITKLLTAGSMTH